MNEFLTSRELYQITGSRKAVEQAIALRYQGFNPWIHPKTGVPILYRDVFKDKQIGDTNTRSFVMNLEQFDA